MHALTRDVVPIGLRFIVDKQQQSVIESAGAEMVNRPVDDGSQTDARIAGASERNHIRLPGQLALSHVMVEHLISNEGPSLGVSLKNEQGFLFVKAQALQCGSRPSHRETLEEIWMLQPSSTNVEICHDKPTRSFACGRL